MKPLLPTGLLIITVTTYGCFGTFPKRYWKTYLDRLEFVSDSTAKVLSGGYPKSISFYHPYFAIASSEDEASIHYNGKLALADSTFAFVPDSVQTQSWPEIRPFIVRIPSIQRSYVNGYDPTTVWLKAGNVTYLFFVRMTAEDTLRYQHALQSSLRQRVED
jgi:hypothetical protein